MKKEELIIRFEKPYIFENQEHKEVDLSGLENLTAEDLIIADKIFYAGKNFAPVTETSTSYICIIAARVSNLPLEFFHKLPVKETMKVKAVVGDFLFSE